MNVRGEAGGVYRFDPSLGGPDYVAKGGVGAVFQTDRPGLLAKLYERAPAASTVEKLRRMVAAPPEEPVPGHHCIAWPRELLVEGGAVVGFVMPRIEEFTLVNLLTVARRRRKQLLGINWYYLHRIACNLAWLFDRIHAAGYVVGDVKPQNAMVSGSALVGILDTDSFQVPGGEGQPPFLCRELSAGYTPPEMQVSGATRRPRTPHQDAFGLAVLVFQLLFGRHPYDGRWVGGGDPPAEDLAVKQGHFMFTAGSHFQHPPDALHERHVHPSLVALFHRTFREGHADPARRPAAKEWGQALEEAIADLVFCGVHNNHVHDLRSAACPWCELVRTAELDHHPALQRDPCREAIHVDQMLTALRTGQEPAIARLAVEHPALLRLPALQGHGGRIGAARERAEAVGRFVELAGRPRPPVDELLTLWGKIGSSPWARRVRVGELTIEGIGRALELGRELLERLGAAVAAAQRDPTELESEMALRRLWQELCAAGLEGEAEEALRGRAEEACARIEEWEAYQAAVRGGDEREMVQVARSSPLLAGFRPFETLRPRLERIERLVAALERAAAEGARGEAMDEEAFCLLWEAAPEMATLNAAGRADPRLEGRSALELYRTAKPRVEALRELEQAVAAADREGTIAEERRLWERARNLGPQLFGCCADRFADLTQRVKLAMQRIGAFDALEQAIGRDDEGEIARAWGDGRVLRGLRDTLPLEERAAAAGARAQCAGELQRALASSPVDEQRLIELWDATPGMKDSSFAAHKGLGLVSLGERVGQARARLRALADVVAHVEEQERYEARHGHLDGEREGAIAASYGANRAVLQNWEAGLATIRERVALAVRRLDAARRLEAAASAGDAVALGRAWDRELLARYAPAAPHRERAERSAAALAELAELTGLYRGDGSADSELLGLWRRAHALRDTGLADEPRDEFGGRTPRELAERAGVRRRLRLKLEHALAEVPRSAEKVVALWDEDLCANHPLFAERAADVEACRRALRRLARLRAALAGGDDAAVCAAWRESLLRECPEVREALPAVEAAFQKHVLAGVRLAAPEQGAVRLAPPEVRVRWSTGRPTAPCCVVAVRDGRYPASPDDVEDPAGHVQRLAVQGPNMAVEVAFELTAAMPFATLWPACVVGGKWLVGAAPLHVRYRRQRRLRWRIRNGLVPFAVPRIEIESDGPDVPRTALYVSEGRRPAPGAAGTRLLQRLPARRGKLVKVPLPRLGRWRRRLELTLVLDEARDDEHFVIEAA